MLYNRVNLSFFNLSFWKKFPKGFNNKLIDDVKVGQLAMETLLSLTSKRAGEWFKEELRDLGGLEHIIKTIVETCRPIDHTITMWSPSLLDRLRKADRCLRVLENVSILCVKMWSQNPKSFYIYKKYIQKLKLHKIPFLILPFCLNLKKKRECPTSLNSLKVGNYTWKTASRREFYLSNKFFSI